MPNLRDRLQAGRADDLAISVPDGPVISYGRLRELVDESSAALVASGVGPGDRVAMAYANGPEAIVLFLAAASVATACPLNPAYTEAEFRYYLEDTGARFLLVPPQDAGPARQALPAGGTLIEAMITPEGQLSVKSRAAQRTDTRGGHPGTRGSVHPRVARSAPWSPTTPLQAHEYFVTKRARDGR